MKMRTSVAHLVTAALALGALVTGLQCNLWGDGDSELPIFTPGELRVSPPSHVFPLVADQNNASALPDVTFVIEATKTSGLGAESIPVRVSVGACSSRRRVVVVFPDGATLGTSNDAGPDGLSVPLGPLASLIDLSIVENGGCKGDSPSFLRCTLSPSGVAKFTVRPHAPVVPTYGQTIPICVAANGGVETEVDVSIAQSIDGGALAFQLGTGAVIPAATARAPRECNIQAVDCSVVRSPVEATVQLVSDGGVIVPSEPTPVQVVLTAGNPRVWLSSSAGDCTAAARPGSLLATLAAGSGASRPFAVCSDGRQGSFTLTAMAPTQPGIRGAFTGSSEPQVAQFNTTFVDAGAGGGIINGRLADCEGKPIPNTPISFRGIDPTSVVVGVASAMTDAKGEASFNYTAVGDAGLAGVVVTAGSNAQSCLLSIRGGQ